MIEEDDEKFIRIYEHRKGAKDRSINNSQRELLMFSEKNIMNSSSFNDL